jgi:hypothetical protein
MMVFMPPSADPPSRSLYEHVGQQLTALISLFGVEAAGATITRAYALLCRQSLDMPCERRPIGASRLNADATPFQFALALGASAPVLQFLAETAPPDVMGAQRIAIAHQRIGDLAVLFGAERALSATRLWLDELAPIDAPDLLADHSGAIWTGAAFAAGASARLKVYVNARWGDVGAQWSRLDQFAHHFDAEPDWRLARQRMPDLHPLGVSLAIGADSQPAGRIYLSGFGKRWEEYEALGAHFGGSAFGRDLRHAGQALLGSDYAYPTRSVVVSLGLQGGAIADIKVELCGHCAFDSDAQAKARCLRWLQSKGFDPGIYVQTLNVLCPGPVHTAETRLHAYLGAGSGSGRPGLAFYFNPAAAHA